MNHVKLLEKVNKGEILRKAVFRGNKRIYGLQKSNVAYICRGHTNII